MLADSECLNFDRYQTSKCLYHCRRNGQTWWSRTREIFQFKNYGGTFSRL